MRHANARGFTLLELIVAAGILALIAVFSWRGLDALVREREAIAASQSTIDVLQRSFARIERDALLAGDAELDGAGAMRLVATGAAGASSIEGEPPTTVEYRIVDGVLTRFVPGADRAPLAMIGNVAAWKAEAWTAAPRGGGNWVDVKGAAVERAPVNRTGAGALAQPPTAATPTPAGAQAAVAEGQPPPAFGTPPPGTPPNGAAPPPAFVPPATGIRLSFALVDGSRIVRSFIVGGG